VASISNRSTVLLPGGEEVPFSFSSQELLAYGRGLVDQHQQLTSRATTAPPAYRTSHTSSIPRVGA